MPSQPLFSLLVTAGLTNLLRETNYMTGKDFIRLQNIHFLSKVWAWLDDAAWPADPLFLEFCADGDAVAAQTQPPLWTMRVQHDDALKTDMIEKLPVNREEWYQPIEDGQLDIQFRHTKPYPGGTIYKSALEFAIHIEGYSRSRSSGSLLGDIAT